MPLVARSVRSPLSIVQVGGCRWVDVVVFVGGSTYLTLGKQGYFTRYKTFCWILSGSFLVVHGRLKSAFSANT